ncbi:MAG: hypothetical protein M3Y87_22905 [Myxococcota bacterium]|nr:hypothetical protein [Myxococcota bacterium]
MRPLRDSDGGAARLELRSILVTSPVRQALIALGLLAALAPLSWLRLRALDHHEASKTYEDVYYLPPSQWLPLISLGHQEALADLIWMRSLVYFGDEIVHRGRSRHVFEYTEAMLELDPDFHAVYRWIATAALYGNAELTPTDVRRAVAVMERGLERFPDDGKLAWDIGATLAFELPPLIEDPEEEEAARRDAAPFLMMATRLGHAPAWMALTNATILNRIGEAETAAQHLEEMYAITRDEATRQQIADAIVQLRSQVYAETFVEMNRAEEERRQRELPYVSPALFSLIGSTEEEDWRDTYRDGFARSLDDDDPVLAE